MYQVFVMTIEIGDMFAVKKKIEMGDMCPPCAWRMIQSIVIGHMRKKFTESLKSPKLKPNRNGKFEEGRRRKTRAHFAPAITSLFKYRNFYKKKTLCIRIFFKN